VDASEVMTVFYNKRTGTVKALVTGRQDMSLYGNEQEDYEQIYDFIVVPLDEYVFSNYGSFAVVNGELKLKETAIPSKYL
jgi:hypothetical protein